MKYAFCIAFVLFCLCLYGQYTHLVNDGSYGDRLYDMIDEWVEAGHSNGPRNLPEPDTTIVATEFPVEISSVLTYAVGDTTTDNSAYFNLLFDDLHSLVGISADSIVEVLLPAGTYYTTDQVELESNTILRGVSADSVYIYTEAREHPLYCDLYALSRTNIFVENATNVGIEDLTVRRLDWQYQWVYLDIDWEAWLSQADSLNWTYPDDPPTGWNLFEILGSNYYGSNISFRESEDCWVTGVVSEAALHHNITIGESTHIEVRGCFIDHSQNVGSGGTGYGVLLYSNVDYPNTTDYCLVENNIFRKCRHAMCVSGDVRHNVFGYNYSREPRARLSSLDIFDHSFIMDMCCHGRGAEKNLFEGNMGNLMGVDNSQESYGYNNPHNGPYNTFFRSKGHSYGIKIDSSQDSTISIDIYNRCTNWIYCNLNTLIDRMQWLIPSSVYAILRSWGLTGDYSSPEMINADIYYQHQIWVKKAKFWGGFKSYDHHDSPDALLDDTYYLPGSELPDFYNPVYFSAQWPFHPENHKIPAYYRYKYSPFKTMSRYDSTGFVITAVWDSVDTITEDLVIERSGALLIQPGAQISINSDVRIEIRGSVIAEGTPENPITITAADTTAGWRGFELGQEWIRSGIFIFPNANHEYGVANFENCIFEYAKAQPYSYQDFHFKLTASGGAISAYHYDDLEIRDCTFRHCRPSRAALYVRRNHRQR
ncbi:MAG: hypothetical protein K8R90_09490 [Candidatus Cloacimonetes bacterium]|nr:hypothetical protein [Candidatus Cloacimonadota bacterium]